MVIQFIRPSSLIFMYLVLRSVLQNIKKTFNPLAIMETIFQILRDLFENLSFAGLFMRRHLNDLFSIQSQVFYACTFVLLQKALLTRLISFSSNVFSMIYVFHFRQQRSILHFHAFSYFLNSFSSRYFLLQATMLCVRNNSLRFCRSFVSMPLGIVVAICR